MYHFKNFIFYFVFQSTFKNMNNNPEYIDDLRAIRSMMEKSSRFLSLSGLSGILMGVYALAGAWVAYRLIYLPPPSPYRQVMIDEIALTLAGIAGAVLFLSLATTLFLTIRRAQKLNQQVWGPGSKQLLINLLIPLATGGLFIVILSWRGVYEVIAPLFLIFYGISLVNAAKFTHPEIFYMGLIQIGLGLGATILPGYGLLFWAAGFGLVHIIYGTVMYLRYEKKKGIPA